MGSGSLLKVLARNFDVLAGPLVALAYPLYASVKAIETKSPVDDQQWLTYWVLYSLITLFELTFAAIIQWLPFWSYMKLFFICWLVLPYFNGAAYMYQNFVRPTFVKNQMVNIWYVPQKKGLFSKPDDFLSALDKFIKENGPEALKRLTNKAGKSSKQAGETSKESKSSKESKELKSPKGLKQIKVPKDSRESKSSKELKPSKDSNPKELKKSLKDPKEPKLLKDPNELKPKKSSKRVTFAKVEPEKEVEASNSDWHPTADIPTTYPEHNPWTNSSFMIFEDETSYWT